MMLSQKKVTSRAARAHGRSCPCCTGPRPTVTRKQQRAQVSVSASWAGNGSAVTAVVPAQMQGAVRAGIADPTPVYAQRTPATDRYSRVLEHFPTALGVDDFIARVEVALCYFGFSGDNSIREWYQHNFGRGGNAPIA